jgi:phytoene dehydrogenase-like protein
MSAKINLALESLPAFRGLGKKDLNARLLIAPSLAEMDLAYVEAKRGEFSFNPIYEIAIPTLLGGNLAPSGHHILSIIFHYAPFGNVEGVDPVGRAISKLEEYAPGIGESVIAAEYLSPESIEKKFSLRGGGWYQGDLRLDQLFSFRPAVGFSHSSTSMAGLYLCGAGCHPGGGISGLSGKFAADAALARRVRR